MEEERQHSRSPFLLLANDYGIMASLCLILWMLTGETLFFVNIFVSTMPGVFFAIPVVLVIAVWKRHIRTALLTVLPIVAFCVLYLPRFQAPVVEAVDGQSVTLLTYNLRVSNRNIEALDTILQEADADIVSLQELNPDIARWIETDLAEQYPHQIVFLNTNDTAAYIDQIFMMSDNPVDYGGRALLSRYPIASYDIVPSDIETTLYIRAELDINGQDLTVYNVHLPPPLPTNIFSTDIRSDGLVDLLQAAEADEHVIFMGDFNMTDRSKDYDVINTQYTDVFTTVERGLGTTWPNGNNLSSLLSFIPSLIRIDYMFVSDDIVPQESGVVYSGVSDHYPVWAEVVLK